MKFSVAVLVLCAFQNSVVLGRIIDEVIEDFRPLILELHNIIGKETNHLGNEDGQYYIEDFENTVTNLNESLDSKLSSIQQSIDGKVNEIVAETGMISHVDQIEHCFAQKDTDSAKLIQTAVAGQEVCLQMAEIDLDNLKTILNDYKNLQYPIHNALEDSVRTCKRNSETGSDMVMCLVDHIVIQVAPELGQTLKDIKTTIAGMSSIVAQRLHRANICLSYVGSKAEMNVDDVIKTFSECCIAASQNVTARF